MARFLLLKAHVLGGTPLIIGTSVADSTANAQPGDFVWSGLNTSTISNAMQSLDMDAIAMRAPSRYPTEPSSWTSGADSIGGSPQVLALPLPPPTGALPNSYITEDGSDFYVTESGDPYVTET